MQELDSLEFAKTPNQTVGDFDRDRQVATFVGAVREGYRGTLRAYGSWVYAASIGQSVPEGVDLFIPPGFDTSIRAAYDEWGPQHRDSGPVTIEGVTRPGVQLFAQVDGTRYEVMRAFGDTLVGLDHVRLPFVLPDPLRPEVLTTPTLAALLYNAATAPYRRFNASFHSASKAQYNPY